MLIEKNGADVIKEEKPVVYFVGMDDDCRKKAFSLCLSLRAGGVWAETDHMSRSVKAQFKYADKLGAKYVAVLGGNELAEEKLSVKNMATGETESVSFQEVCTYFQEE